MWRRYSAGLATCIDSSCTKKPAKEKLLTIQERYIHPKQLLFLLAPRVNPDLWDDLSDSTKGRLRIGVTKPSKALCEEFSFRLLDWQICFFRRNQLVRKVSTIDAITLFGNALYEFAMKRCDLSIVNGNKDMVRKAGKLQRLFARMLIDHISQVTWYAKVHNFQGVTF